MRPTSLVPRLSTLLLSACSGGEAGSATEPSGPQWFVEAAAASGVRFTCDPGPGERFAMPEIMGGGVGLLDVDGDGDLDLDLRSGEPTGAAASTNLLYRNDGSGRFEDVTAASGLVSREYGMGVGAADVDGDGALDVVLGGLALTQLFRQGDGRFAVDPGFAVTGWATSLAFLDLDRDGHLDLYVARYLQYDPDKRCEDAAGRPDFCGPKSFRPVPDVLLRNLEGRAFEDVSAAVGLTAVAGAGLGVVIDDFDEDGWIDVYVANDGYANDLWLNDAGRRLVAAGMQRGTAFNAAGQALAGMGVLSADLDLDTRPDLFVTNLFQETNSLYRNVGDGLFTDATGVSGLAGDSRPYTGFGTNAFDLELDGDLDLLVVNGRVARGERRPASGLASPWDEYAEPDLLYANDGAGRFAPFGPEVSAVTTPVRISRGSVAGDLDGDGDLDLVVNDLGSPCRILRNEAPRAGHWLRVRALDPRLARDALGAIVRVHTGTTTRRAVVSTAGSYLASADPVLHVGLGPAAAYDGIDVHWPDGLHERFEGGPADRGVTLERGRGEALR